MAIYHPVCKLCELRPSLLREGRLKGLKVPSDGGKQPLDGNQWALDLDSEGLILRRRMEGMDGCANTRQNVELKGHGIGESRLSSKFPPLKERLVPHDLVVDDNVEDLFRDRNIVAGSGYLTTV